MAELLGTLMEVIKACWAWIYLLCPIKIQITNAGELGVRYTLGKPGRSLSPGLHLATTLQTLSSDQAKLCKNNIDEIHVLMADCVPIKVNAVVAYSIKDLGAFQTASQDTHWLISEFAEACLKEELNDVSFHEYHANRKAKEKKVVRGVQALAKEAEFGVVIKYVRVTSFEVNSQTIQTALAAETIVKMLDNVPDNLPMAKVALVANAQPINTMEDGAEDEEEEIDED